MDDDLQIQQGERATGLDIPLLLSFRNAIWGAFGPHRIKLTQIRPWRAMDGRSSMTLNLIFTEVTPHERRKIEFYNVTAAQTVDGTPIPDLRAFLATAAGRPDLLTYGTLPRY